MEGSNQPSQSVDACKFESAGHSGSAHQLLDETNRRSATDKEVRFCA